jgi:copper chaperone CopZ
MKSISRIVLALTAMFGAHSASHAADKTGLVHYEGRIAGVVCAACSSSVKEALMSIEGVKEVRISISGDGSVPRLEITSTSPALTREAAMKALGSSASDFQIQALEKVSSK